MTLPASVQNYMGYKKGLPFFYVVGDENYPDIINQFKQYGFTIDRVSDFCLNDDKFPSVDQIIDYFKSLDNNKPNKHLLVGLGELLALKGNVIAEKELRRLEKVTFENSCIIFLLRGVSQQVHKLVKDESRLVQQQRVWFEDNTFCNVKILCNQYSSNEFSSIGVKQLLRSLEEGKTGECEVRTLSRFPDSLFQVKRIESAYEAICQAYPDLELNQSLGLESQWDLLYKTLSNSGWNLDNVFKEWGFKVDCENDIYPLCAGLEFKNWLFFLFLKKNQDILHNSYLKLVVNKTENYEELYSSILTSIVHISRNDKNFKEFYNDRKRLVRNFPEGDISQFIYLNEKDPEESIYRYTDNTLIERQKIIQWISDYGLIPEIDYIYPDLSLYLKDYHFNCGKQSEIFTSYFRDYKRTKLTNSLTPGFIDRVNQYATSLPYTHVMTLANAVQKIGNKKSTFLYWIDALGVEYLSYITELVHRKGLSMHVDIAYSQLPTITSINRNFYDEWPGKKKKNSELDDIKHKGKKNYIFDEFHKAPVHLAAELKVIEDAINYAATELQMHHFKSFVVASDHGSSRLAVLYPKSVKYEVETKGEHSGRCCPDYPDAEFPNAVKENGYVVLADYGRFNKSRAASVEVHGGATLEEVLVPVITLSLKQQNPSEIQIVNKDNIQADRSGTEILLYLTGIENPDKVWVNVESKCYTAQREDPTHFRIKMKEFTRKKRNISAAVYDGDNLIGDITFDIKGRLASVDKKEFDDLEF